MSGEFWRSEVVIFGLMFINMAALATALAWAWRRGHLSNLSDETTGLDVSPEPIHQETRNG
jgi:hypothetical protein